MNELKIFENPEFGSVRTVVINNEPWFVGKDVCLAFGDTNYRRSLAGLDDYDKGVSQIDTPGGKQNMTVINESGLYSLLFQMQPQKARNESTEHVEERVQKLKRFKHWVTSEVLPSIRKNGGYIQNQENLTPEQIVANALIVANKIIADKDQKIAEMEPKAKYFDNLVDSKLLTTFRDTAKELHVPPKTFVQWLMDKKYIYRDRHNVLKPYEQHRKNGLFQLKDFSTPFGYSNVQTYVTVKGKETFRLLLNVEDGCNA